MLEKYAPLPKWPYLIGQENGYIVCYDFGERCNVKFF